MTTKAMEIRMVDTVGQYRKIQAEVDAAIREVLDSGMYINGPAVKAFQQNLAGYLGAKSVIPCANGTDALQVALMALGLQPGDEVITVSFTFVATVETIALLGLRPVFVDIDPVTFNMDPAKIEAAITPKTKAILPVHLYGQPADMEPIMAIAKKHGLYVVEDNAQAIGSEYTFSDGRTVKAGLIGDLGTTSFYPSKNLGAYGDAGAVFTMNPELGHKVQVVCNHGSEERYFHSEVGVNSRLDSMQAAVLDVKLRHLDEYAKARQAAAAAYNRHFAGVDGLVTPQVADNATHVFHQYTLRVLEGRAKRDRIREELTEKGIPAMIYYPVPLHEQEAYKPFEYAAMDLPVTEQFSGEVISLAMHTELTTEQIDYIASHFLASFHK